MTAAISSHRVDAAGAGAQRQHLRTRVLWGRRTALTAAPTPNRPRSNRGAPFEPAVRGASWGPAPSPASPASPLVDALDASDGASGTPVAPRPRRVKASQRPA